MASEASGSNIAASDGTSAPIVARTVFHWVFARLLEERCPNNVQILFDQPLAIEPQRADLVIIRRSPKEPPGEAQVLRQLWNLLPAVTVGEFKSVSRPLRKGELSKLLGYGAQYHSRETKQFTSSRDLALALFVPSWTPTLDDELAAFGWTAQPLGNGYFQINAQPYPLFVAVLDTVCEAERDAVLALLTHSKLESAEAFRWWAEHADQRREMKMENLEGMEELMARMPLSLRLLGLKPEQLLSRIKPEERLSDLKPEEQILSLSDEVLATFPPSYVATLPSHVREEIERRLTRH